MSERERRVHALAGRVSSYEGWLVAAVVPLLIVPALSRAAWPLAAVIVAALLAANLASGQTLRLGLSLELPLLALLVMLAVSLVVSLDRPASLPRATTTLAGMLVFRVFARRREAAAGMIPGSLWLMLIGCSVALAGLLGAEWQPAKVFTLWPVYDRLPEPAAIIAQVAGGSLHVNLVGGALAACLPAAVGLALFVAARATTTEARAPQSFGVFPPLSLRLRGAVAPLASAGLLLMSAVLILTQSRSSYLGAGAGLAAIALLMSRRAARALPLLAACVLAVVVAWAVLAGGAGMGAVAGATADDGATRAEIWTNALRLLPDYPLTGAGLWSFDAISRANYAYSLVLPDYRLSHAHNIFLQTAMDFGVPGLLAFLALLLVLAAGSLRLSAAALGQPYAVLAAGLGGSLAAAIVAGQTDVATLPFGVPSGLPFWIAAGALAGAWRSARAEVATSPQRAGRTVQRGLAAGAVVVVIALLAGLAGVRWLQINEASLAADRLLLSPDAAHTQDAKAPLALLQTSSRLAGGWQSVRLGRVHLALGDQAAAVAVWRQAPAEAGAYLMSQGDSYFWRGDPLRAERFYRLALLVNNDAPAQYRLARAVETAHDGEAAELYTRALAANVGLDEATQLDARLRLGRLLARRGDWPAALEQYDLGLAVTPKSGDLIVARAQTLAALSGNAGRVESLLEEASESLPANLSLYRALVSLCQQNGQTDKARAWAERSLHAAPGSAWPQIMMGQVLLAENHAPASITYFRRAGMMRRDLADPHLGLAAAYLRLGDAAAAAREARTAGVIEPYKPEVQAAVAEMLRTLDVPR